jgi:glucosamine--fructose-6-phosphate aminotransferase (isomerizing)
LILPTGKEKYAMQEAKSAQSFFIYETIFGAPEILSNWLKPECKRRIDHIAEQVIRLKPHHVFLSGTGSSYLAAIAQAYGFNRIAGVPSSAWIRSELMTYTPNNFNENAVLFFNTHSGKSPGDVSMIERAKERGVYTVGVTDVPDSAFAKSVDELLIGADGPKKEMPSTRTYSSAIFRALQVAISCAEKTGSISHKNEYKTAVERIPQLMKAILDEIDLKANDLVKHLKNQRAFYIISAGPNMSTAYEGAMGLTQGTGKPAAGFNVDEYINGPIQSLSSEDCVITVAAPGPFELRIGKCARTARSIGAKTVVVAPQKSESLKEGNISIPVPDGIPEVLTPVLYCAPFWLIGYYFSLSNGFDPDNLSMKREAFKKSGLAELKKEIY